MHTAVWCPQPNVNLIKNLLRRTPSEELEATTKQGNIALHLAASNLNTTGEIIACLNMFNPVRPNSVGMSSFSLAAHNANHDVIVDMIEVFVPTYWVMINNDPYNTNLRDVFYICAIKGNAKAIRLLMQRGIEFDKSIFGFLVEESVKNRSLLQDLVAVYHTIVDNILVWFNLLRNNEAYFDDSICAFCSSPDTNFEELMNLKHKLVTSLIENSDAFTLAFKHGATDMFRTIINTEDVYRFSRKGHFWHDGWLTKFDITYFSKYCRKSLSYGTLLWDESNLLQTVPLCAVADELVPSFHWCFILLSVVQITFMVYFSVCYMLDRCSLSRMFQLNIADCDEPLLRNNRTNDTVTLTQYYTKSFANPYLIV